MRCKAGLVDGGGMMSVKQKRKDFQAKADSIIFGIVTLLKHRINRAPRAR